MKPKPFVSLNHFTVPVVRIAELLNDVCGRRTIFYRTTGYMLNVIETLTRGLTLPVRHCAAQAATRMKKGTREKQAPDPMEQSPGRSTGCVAETNSNTIRWEGQQRQVRGTVQAAAHPVAYTAATDDSATSINVGLAVGAVPFWDAGINAMAKASSSVLTGWKLSCFRTSSGMSSISASLSFGRMMVVIPAR